MRELSDRELAGLLETIKSRTDFCGLDGVLHGRRMGDVSDYWEYKISFFKREGEIGNFCFMNGERLAVWFSLNAMSLWDLACCQTSKHAASEACYIDLLKERIVEEFTTGMLLLPAELARRTSHHPGLLDRIIEQNPSSIDFGERDL
jgi:hypothetical protein